CRRREGHGAERDGGAHALDEAELGLARGDERLVHAEPEAFGQRLVAGATAEAHRRLELGELASAVGARGGVRTYLIGAGSVELAAGHVRQQFTGVGAVHGSSCPRWRNSASLSASRPRLRRDLTVPTGPASAPAISS